MASPLKYTDGVTRRHAAAILRVSTALLLVLVSTAAAVAEHTAYYRYVILGFAADARGRPLASLPVEVIRDKTGLAHHGETDEKGFYLLVVRLGDESVGERLTLRVGSAQTWLTARFDPDNHVHERGTRVDLVAGKPVERADRFRSTLRDFLAAQ